MGWLFLFFSAQASLGDSGGNTLAKTEAATENIGNGNDNIDSDSDGGDAGFSWQR